MNFQGVTLPMRDHLTLSITIAILALASPSLAQSRPQGKTATVTALLIGGVVTLALSEKCGLDGQTTFSVTSGNPFVPYRATATAARRDGECDAQINYNGESVYLSDAPFLFPPFDVVTESRSGLVGTGAALLGGAALVWFLWPDNDPSPSIDVAVAPGRLYVGKTFGF